MNTYKRNSHCSYCGTAFAEGLAWPRQCANCGNISYINPLPVAVIVVPVGTDGVLLVRRAIEPRKGLVALPGGFIGMGETWQEAGAREVREETGITLNPAEITLYDTLTALEGMLLVFGLAPAIPADAIPTDFPTDETEELVVATGPTTLAFPLHQQVFDRYWQER